MEELNKDKEANTTDGNDATPTELPEKLSQEDLEKLLAAEQKKSTELYDSLQRARADFINLKRRTENEKAGLSNEVKERTLLRLLPTVDDFERALATTPENLKGEPWLNGVKLIEKKLKTFLEQEGIAEVEALDAEFDPRFHEAVQKDDSTTGDKEVVIEVYQKGYKLGDKVIRPAVVKVGHR